MGEKKPIIVVAHADMCGLQNVNLLWRRIRDRFPGQPVLFALTGKSNGESNTQQSENEIPQLAEIKLLQETYFHRLLDHVDSSPDMKEKGTAQWHTFRTLNRLAGNADDMLHYVHSGKQGGQEIEALVDKYQPSIVLDCGSMATLSDKTVADVPCYFTHCGPLPQARGRHGALRQIIHERFEGTSERPLITGSIVRLMPEPQDAKTLSNKHLAYERGQSLFTSRNRMYEAMVNNVCWLLPGLLAGGVKPSKAGDAARQHGADRYAVTAAPHDAPPVPPLTPEQVDAWLDKGNKLYNHQEILDFIRCVVPPKVKLSTLLEAGLSPPGIEYEDVVTYDNRHRSWEEKVKKPKPAEQGFWGFVFGR